MMESTDSSSGSQQPQLPPGYRFHPTDEELVVHYLKKKIASDPLPVSIIAEVDLYKFDPWELPGKATFGDQEWYFFSPRDRKYPNGARPNRAATSGYWKATGTDKPILTAGGTQKIGVKKALVFYRGKPPKGIKSNWIMHEYRLIDNTGIMKPPGTKKNSSRLDDWVLCRIYKKNNSQRSIECDKDVAIDNGFSIMDRQHNLQAQAAKATNCGLYLENNETFFEGLLSDSVNNNNTLSHLASSSSKPDVSIMVPPSASTMLPLRRTLQSPYWNEAGSESSDKRFQTNQSSSSGGGSIQSNSVVNMLNQIPQQASPFHHQVLLGSLGDGVYRQQYQQVSGINWNS
ncbi:hypothetical protein AQUCO_02400081v1 [Aquilegia coerulea]|uniref:NAC domain-containing protein n=1 Tax=Aquilegia coerulea TaxID=218851 RepID=A0A2G5DB67_AQUCA|nr:hypothetical protein AQUCO_02400081v1 [Aquilegia coerulea]